MSAPDAPIWILIQQIVAQLAAITVVGGYRTDLGATVSAELAQVHADDPDADPPPRIVVALDGEISLDSVNTGRRGRKFRIACEAAFWGDDQDSQAAAHAALEDMVSVLAPYRQYIQVADEVISDVRVAGASVLARPEGLPVVAAVMYLDVHMLELREPQWTQSPVPPP